MHNYLISNYFWLQQIIVHRIFSGTHIVIDAKFSRDCIIKPCHTKSTQKEPSVQKPIKELIVASQYIEFLHYCKILKSKRLSIPNYPKITFIFYLIAYPNRSNCAEGKEKTKWSKVYEKLVPPTNICGQRTRIYSNNVYQKV